MFGLLKSGFDKVKNALSKTSSQLSDKIRSLFGKPLDEETFDELERILYEADLGSELVAEFVDRVEKEVKRKPSITPELIIDLLKKHAREILSKTPSSKERSPSKPEMILIVGVNGSGKTTSIAKLAHSFQKQKKKVLLAAGDTFRAAAIEQLEIWAKRTKTEIVKGAPGGDPSSVIFDALTAAKARGMDLVLADTAGRLQSKTDLMEELAKIKRVSDKVIPGAPHEIYLVLDTTTGQNAIDQAKTFNEFTPLTGIILTKLDGSAKGGIILSIYRQMGIPVKYIGVGEKVDDLIPFNVDNYIEALFAK